MKSGVGRAGRDSLGQLLLILQRVLGVTKEEAQREPVAITSHGRISGYFVSEREYKELQRLRAFERRIFRIRELPPEISRAIKAAKMDSTHDHLNALMDER